MRVFTSAASLDHWPGAGHPEQPERLSAVLTSLRTIENLPIIAATPASRDAVVACHDRDYLARAEALSARGGGELGTDTTLSRGSWDAAIGATGAALAALDYAHSGAGHAFAAIRPPGHHALAARAMGFCVINHVAVTASAARRLGRENVLIVDWDVHAGNGTQALVEREPRTRFVSMHQWPWYPGTGSASERGVGNCFNIPMPAQLDSSVYVESLWAGLETATRDWRPDIILISAGYDGMRGDPLGGFTLEPEDFVTWVDRLRERFPALPMVAVMEGGYAPARLAAGVVATVGALA
jgi:acetoin utilization deacetylase AcuC-like enzyme